VRTLALIALLAAVALAAAGERIPPVPRSTDVKDVEVSLSTPKEVRLTPARERGGPVATFTAKVTIKNTGSRDLPFSRHYLTIITFDRGPQGPVDRRLVMRWHDEPDRKDLSAFAIRPGQSYTATIQWSFLECEGQPRQGETVTVILRIYGHKAKAAFIVK
jgi:hypothetical protein